MNRSLALLLAIVVILLVDTVAGEGGALDNFSGGRNASQLAAADPEEAGQQSPADLAVATAIPAPAAADGGSDWTDEIGMYGEEEPRAEEPRAERPAPPPPPAAEREHTPRVGNRGDVGALDRSRMGIEE